MSVEVSDPIISIVEVSDPIISIVEVSDYMVSIVVVSAMVVSAIEVSVVEVSAVEETFLAEVSNYIVSIEEKVLSTEVSMLSMAFTRPLEQESPSYSLLQVVTWITIQTYSRVNLSILHPHSQNLKLVIPLLVPKSIYQL